jgi:hypothetical protein
MTLKCQNLTPMAKIIEPFGDDMLSKIAYLKDR